MAYKAARIKTAAPATVRFELRMIGRAMRLASMVGRIESLPIIPMVSVDNARTGFASPGEIEKVIEHAGERVGPLIRMLYDTGMRSHEALDLRWSRVDLDEGVIRLRPEDTKTRKARLVPLRRATLELLRERRRANKVVSITEDQSVFGVAPITFRRTWRKAVKAAGLTLRPHDLRRSFARNAIRSGVSQHVAMKILGHTTTSMFTRYNVSSTADLVDAVDRLETYLTAPQTAPRQKSGQDGDT